MAGDDWERASMPQMPEQAQAYGKYIKDSCEYL